MTLPPRSTTSASNWALAPISSMTDSTISPNSALVSGV